MHPNPAIRAIFWGLTWVFSAIVLGLTASRIHFTKTFRGIDPVSGNTSHFYDPIIVELLVTACLVLLGAPVFMLLAATAEGIGAVYAELVFAFIVWVMYLVGSAIATHFWHGLGRCWSLRICKIITATLAFIWTSWAFITFILVAIPIWFVIRRRRAAPTGPRAQYAQANAAPVSTAAAAPVAPAPPVA
ncbi:hypothetical protein AX16_000871 [Volvariella volvacea WC 439]|nr:hypothetical protein AX16_000871 [Volvariella volvacea WC 439]